MRLRGGRTGLRAITCAGLELTGLMKPFGLEVFYGERVAVLGSNGSGKSHFLRLLAGADVAHTGSWKLGARVVPGSSPRPTPARSWRGGRWRASCGTCTPATAAPR
jgi:energy-coupling factor transporter ATP-binding protein EcfA2